LRYLPLIALCACGGPAPVEIDGDQIRALIRDVVDVPSRSTASIEALETLARRSPEARDAVFREVDRSHRAAAVRANAAREEEIALSSGGTLDAVAQARLSALVHERASCERSREALRALLARIDR